MTERRFDLDWLRIIVFAWLILYHIGMFYVTWGWHVKSSRASDWIEPLMLLSSPWRLTLLFLIAGAATRFIADKMTAGELAISRMKRLWPPLLLAVFVIVPPQSYYEVVEALQEMNAAEATRSEWLQGFYLKYVTASGGWCDHEGCLITPTYNHMWFVAYLIIYTLALIALLPLIRKLPTALGLLLKGPGLVLTPWLVLFALRATLLPRFGQTHAFWDDWYLHSIYFAVFVFGFCIAKSSGFFERAVRIRWLALVLALGAWASVIALIRSSTLRAAISPNSAQLLFHAATQLQAWAAVLAALGLAHHHLRNADGPMRRVLTQAIFSFYLIHQTIIVITAHHLDELQLPLAIEVPLLITATAVGCWLFYDLGRRVPWLRIWIGLSPDRPETYKGATKPI